MAQQNTAKLEMSPMQWAELEAIDDVEAINEKDYACLAEIRDVLNKHGKRERFGVALLHKHFDMAQDELLMEYSSRKDRVLTIKPIKQEAAGHKIETIWKLQDGEKGRMLECQQFCKKDVHGNEHDPV